MSISRLGSCGLTALELGARLVIAVGPVSLDAAVGGSYEDDKQYYLPVNVKLVADSPRLLDMLPKVIAPPEEVCKYMEEVMETSELADDIYIGSQLPVREKKKANGVDGSKSSGQEEKLAFGAPNSLIPF